MLRSLHMLVLALAATLGIASSATAITSETALSANRDFPAHRVTDFDRQAREAHQQSALGYGGDASDSSLAARGGGETLSRLGTSKESASRLGRKAAEAEGQIGIHGVSTTAGTPKGAASQAARGDVEQAFKVHDTPTRADPLHRTVELPKPVTQQIADTFNRIFGRD